MSFTLIQSSEDLEILNKELLDKRLIAIDTEFRRKSKKEIRLALIQINDGQEIFLIDCISIGPYKGGCTFLTDKKVLKIFHACREDLEVLVSWMREDLLSVYDTQLANAFLGGSFAISYQRLVKNELGVLLDKDETRSNWVKRPLRDSQLRYASSDVQFLLDIYKIQIKKLQRLKRLDWLNQEIDYLKEKVDEQETTEKLKKGIVLTKSEEKEFLKALEGSAIQISESIGINKTLLFSKKEQRELLKRITYEGVESALGGIREWKKDLIIGDLTELVKKLNLLN